MMSIQVPLNNYELVIPVYVPTQRELEQMVSESIREHDVAETVTVGDVMQELSAYDRSVMDRREDYMSAVEDAVRRLDL